MRNYSFETVRIWREYFNELERERDAKETVAAVCRQFAERRCSDAQCREQILADCEGGLPETATASPEDTTFHGAHLRFDLANAILPKILTAHSMTLDHLVYSGPAGAHSTGGWRRCLEQRRCREQLNSPALAAVR